MVTCFKPSPKLIALMRNHHGFFNPGGERLLQLIAMASNSTSACIKREQLLDQEGTQCTGELYVELTGGSPDIKFIRKRFAHPDVPHPIWFRMDA